MRLTDKCTIIRSSTPQHTDTPCQLGHTGGDVPTLAGHTRYIETARVIVGPLPDLAAVQNVAGWTVEHHGKAYKVTAILPRYRQRGRLHHVSLDLEVVTG